MQFQLSCIGYRVTLSLTALTLSRSQSRTGHGTRARQAVACEVCTDYCRV